MKAITFPLFFILCAGLVLALPVTYKGDILIDGVNGTNVDVKITTNLQSVEKTFNENYFINIEGDAGTETNIYVWGALVYNFTQPAMGTTVNRNINFTKLSNGQSCSNGNACSSGNCCGTCQTSCNTGGGSSGGSGGSSNTNNEDTSTGTTTSNNPIKIDFRCSTPQTETCSDGSTIIKKECKNGSYIETENVCPVKECETDEKENCWDGSEIIKRKCIDNKYIDSKESCPERECTEDLTETCNDKTQITTKRCDAGRYVETDEKCQKHNSMVMQFILVFILAILFSYKLYKDKKKKNGKSGKDEENQFEKYIESSEEPEIADEEQ